MRFSVIVPIYNAGAYLQECVDSVLAQSLRDWELILVDDGSTDGSGALADDYARKDQRVRVVHKENGGQLFARRDGLAAALGEYVLFLDSDDCWRPDCLATISAAIDEQSPDVVMFVGEKFGDAQCEGKRVGVASDQVQWLEKQHIYRVLLSGVDYNSLCFKAWKRTLFEADPTDYSAFAGTCWGEDKVQLLYPITQAKNVLFLPDALYRYRYNADSVIHNIDLTKIPVMLSNSMFELLYRYMKLWDMDDADSRETVAVYYLRNYLSAYYKLRRGCKDKAARKGFREFDWGSVTSRDAFRYALSRTLSVKERLKLVLARYVRI